MVFSKQTLLLHNASCSCIKIKMWSRSSGIPVCFSVFCDIPFVNDTHKNSCSEWIQWDYHCFPICVYKVWSTVLQVVKGLKTFSGQVPRLLQACFSSHFLQPLRENWIITVGCRKEDYSEGNTWRWKKPMKTWKPYHFMQLEIKNH